MVKWADNILYIFCTALFLHNRLLQRHNITIIHISIVLLNNKVFSARQRQEGDAALMVANALSSVRDQGQFLILPPERTL